MIGNDDCGQMSAWYIFSTLGFYPVNPAKGNLVLGLPQANQSILHLQLGKKMIIRLKNEGKIKSVKLNGKVLNCSWISFDELNQGGKLEFE